MKIAIDISPLESGNFLQHRVRGTGSYIRSLRQAMLHFFPENSYTFFSDKKKIPDDCDIVHIPYFEPFFLTLPLFNRYTTVVTVHDMTPLVFPKYFPSGIKGKVKWMIQKSRLQKVDTIITDSFASKRDINRFVGVPSEKVQVVYLAAGDSFRQVEEKKQRAVRSKYALPEKFVLYVGDVTWNKNLPRLLDAVFSLDVHLVMVGNALTENTSDLDNPWNRDLRVVRKKIANNPRIIPLGFVSDEDLVALYNTATVFAMPSLYEGFGLPLLEAMSSGCPVVTARQGSLEEVAGDAAIYVDAYNVESIAEGVKKVFLSKKIRDELVDKGLQQAKKFTWEKTAKETLQVYKNTIKNR